MAENSTKHDRGDVLVFGLLTVVALWFVYSYALFYLTIEPSGFGIYWPRHEWLYAHIVAGIVALVLGPTQFWLGLTGRKPSLHRVLGLTYVTAVAIGGIAAFYLAFHTDFGWVFGVGFSGMAAAWIISTGLGIAAILRRLVEQHREWMIRSYVVTFGFVTFRVLDAAFDTAQFGTLVERMTAASWLAWTIPLMITEAILQGKKIFARRVSVRVVPLPTVNVDTAVPEPMEFGLRSSESSYLPPR